MILTKISYISMVILNKKIFGKGIIYFPFLSQNTYIFDFSPTNIYMIEQLIILSVINI